MAEPYFIKYWKDIGFNYVDINDGYVRVSDNEFDITGAKVILFDGFGNFRAYKISEKHKELVIEFNPEMSRALYKTWKWLKMDWIVK